MRAVAGLEADRPVRCRRQPPRGPRAIAPVPPLLPPRRAGLHSARWRHTGIVRCLRWLVELGFQFRDPPFRRLKTLQKRQDQRVLLDSAQAAQVRNGNHSKVESYRSKPVKRSPARGRAPPVHENMAKPLVTVAESIDLSDGDRREVGLEQVNQSRSRD